MPTTTTPATGAPNTDTERRLAARYGWPLPIMAGADGAADPPADPPASDPPAGDPPAGDPPADEAALGDAGRRALQAERDRVKAETKRANELAARVKEFEDRDKSESDRLKDEKAAAEARATVAEQAVMRLKVGQKKGLPTEIAELLHGDDEEAMTKHADRLIKAGVTANGGGRPSFDGGVRRQPPPAGGMDAAIRAAAGRG